MARVDAAEEFLRVAERLVILSQLKWADVEADYRLLAINSALRRQLECLSGAVALARSGLGHLAVGYVRPALEDVMYLRFFLRLPLDESQELFVALGTWDQLRSLIAQRNYIGDEQMESLWYPKQFLQEADGAKIQARARLRDLQKKHAWGGGDVPSGAWIADQADERALYDYLFAASSRAIHFSAGEMLRRAWGTPGGILITDKPEFRGHLAEFALDQLVRLYFKTISVVMPLIERSGVTSEEGLEFDEHLKPVLERVMSFGEVPLVHTYEWNLTPDNPT